MEEPRTVDVSPALRLSIMHLFVIVTGCAIAIAATQQIYAAFGLSHLRGSWISYALISGLQLSGAIIFVVWVLIPRPSRAIEPGHCVLLIHAFGFVVSTPIVWAQVSGLLPYHGLTTMLITKSPFVMAVVACLIVAKFFVCELRWSLVFLLMAMTLATTAIASSLYLTIGWTTYAFIEDGGQFMAGIILLLTVCIATYELGSERRTRDYLHWMGVGTLIASTTLQMYFG